MNYIWCQVYLISFDGVKHYKFVEVSLSTTKAIVNYIEMNVFFLADLLVARTPSLFMKSTFKLWIYRNFIGFTHLLMSLLIMKLESTVWCSIKKWLRHPRNATHTGDFILPWYLLPTPRSASEMIFRSFRINATISLLLLQGTVHYTISTVLV